MEHLTYRGYTASISYDKKDKVFVGKVLDLEDEITFEEENAKKIEQTMKETIDAHLVFCQENGFIAAKPFSGRFSVRTSSEIHKRIFLEAAGKGLTINKWLEQFINIHLLTH